MPLLAAERQARIVELVQARRSVRVSDLARELDVSAMTVRRDIEALEEVGSLERVHGGARMPSNPVAVEPAPDEKSLLQREEKDAIAHAASRYVRAGDVVGIGAGTTTLALARELLDVDDLTVVATAVPVAELFWAHSSARVVLIGGERTISDALVGPVALQSIQQLNLDVLFLGAHGMDAERGFTAPNLLEAQANRYSMAQARSTVVLADSAKWSVVGLSSFARFGDVDVLVSDSKLAPEAAQTLAASVETVLLADAASGTTRRVTEP